MQEVLRDDPQTENGSQQATLERKLILTWICNKTWDTDTAFINNNEQAEAQTSSAVLLRSPLFWDKMQRRLVIGYRFFGSAYQSIFNGQSFCLDSTFENGTGRQCRNVGKQLPTYGALHLTTAETSILIIFIFEVLAVLHCHVGYAVCWPAVQDRISASSSRVKQSEKAFF